MTALPQTIPPSAPAVSFSVASRGSDLETPRSTPTGFHDSTPFAPSDPPLLAGKDADAQETLLVPPVPTSEEIWAQLVIEREDFVQRYAPCYAKDRGECELARKLTDETRNEKARLLFQNIRLPAQSALPIKLVLGFIHALLDHSEVMDPTQPPEQSCWRWFSALIQDRGQFHLFNRLFAAPRAALALVLGRELQTNELATHSVACAISGVGPACCNPLHLTIGDASSNNGPDRVRDGTQLVGEKHGRAKLRDVQREAICSDTRIDRVVAEEYGVSRSHVNNIKNERAPPERTPIAQRRTATQLIQDMTPKDRENYIEKRLKSPSMAVVPYSNHLVPVEMDPNCHLWTAGVNRGRLAGMMQLGPAKTGFLVIGHIVTYALATGRYETNIQRLCGVNFCVNPKHLIPSKNVAKVHADFAKAHISISEARAALGRILEHGGYTRVNGVYVRLASGALVLFPVLPK